MNMRVVLLTVCTLVACSVTPQAGKPLASGNAPFRHAPVGPSAVTNDSAWPALFGDPTLTSLIDAAVANNYEIESANARIA
jgi:multidrug efflux system outer membrane protein